MTSAGYVINEVSKVIKRTEKVTKVFNSYAEGMDLKDMSNNLTKAEHYKEYYYKVAQKASKMASVFKSLSDKLPPGMREYYEFIFTIAENTDKMAKVVYDYTGRLEKAIKELDKDSKSRGEKNSKFNIDSQISNETIPQSPEDATLKLSCLIIQLFFDA